MSVYVYKDDKKELIEPLFLDSFLKAGWRVTEKVDPGPRAEELQEDEKPNLGDLRTAAQVREEARAAGIDGWEKKRIGTLKAELSAK